MIVFNCPGTLISGFVLMSKSIAGFLPETNSYGLKLARFGQLNVLYVNIANGNDFMGLHFWFYT